MGVGYSIQARASNAAEIYIYEDVGEGWFGGVSAKQFADDLAALGAIQALDVRINSYGGDVFDGLAIYRQLVDHPARVTVHVDGIAASIASVIAMAGDEIRIAEAGFFMVHPAQGGVFGPAPAMREMADLLDRVTGSIATVYQSRTGKDAAAVLDWINAANGAGTWFTGAEAVDAGLADALAPNMLMAARADDAAAHQARFVGRLKDHAADRTALRPAAQEVERLRQAADLLAAAPPAPAAAPEPSASRPHASAIDGRLNRLKARLTLAAPGR